jgi:hypothetical protein
MAIDRPEPLPLPGTLEQIEKRHAEANAFVNVTQLHRDREDLLQIIHRISECRIWESGDMMNGISGDFLHIEEVEEAMIKSNEPYPTKYPPPYFQKVEGAGTG